MENDSIRHVVMWARLSTLVLLSFCMSIDLEACLLVFEIEKERKNFKDH